MENPFEIINQRLDRIEKKLEQLVSKTENIKGNETSPGFLTMKQFCEYYDYKRPTVYGMVHHRKIPYSKVGKRLYFEKSKIDEWIRQKHVKTITEIEEEADNYLSRNRIRN